MSPVLAIPCLNRPDLLAKAIASIDIPVRLLVIDNSGQGITLDVLPDDAHVLDMPANIGYPASVNLAIKCYPLEPYWLVANADVEFAPGDLHRLVGATESGDWGWVGVVDWRVFGLTAETVLRVGFFDEDFHPAFCEDADYERRCTLAGVRWGAIPGDTTHVRSVSLADHAQDNARSYPSNVEHHVAKWGVPPRGAGGYATPFDKGYPSPGPSLSRLRANAWRRDGGAGSGG